MIHPFVRRSLALVFAAALFAGCQTTDQPSGRDRFNKVDTNKDGKLSQAEASDYIVTKVFEARDKNGDGKMTWEEWHVEGDNSSKTKFAARDTNKDGVVSLDEALTYGRKSGIAKEAFHKADTNKDGYLSYEEARAYYGQKEGRPD